MSCTLLLSIIGCWCLATTLVENASANNTTPLPLYDSYDYNDSLVQGSDHRLDQMSTLLENIHSKMDLQQLSQVQAARNETRATVAVMRRTADEIRALAVGVRELLGPQKAVQRVPPTPGALPASCAEAVATSGRSGIHLLQPDRKQPAFFAPCLADKAGGAAWTLVQRRQDGSINFYIRWNEYQRGFGNLAGEFFIGLDRLHALTHSTLHELCIQLEDFEGAKRRACYDAFAIGDESRAYALELLGKFSGDVGDSLRYHEGSKFRTRDKDTPGNCASTYGGAWWFNQCHQSDLNGEYLKGNLTKKQHGEGVMWNSWRGNRYSLKYAHMAIRPVT